MEFTSSSSSIFQNKKIKYNNRKPTKNGIIWINFSKIRKARCTLAHTSLGAYSTVYLARSCRRSTHICLRFTTANIRYTETLFKIARRLTILNNGRAYRRCSASRSQARDIAQQRLSKMIVKKLR